MDIKADFIPNDYMAAILQKWHGNGHVHAT